LGVYSVTPAGVSFSSVYTALGPPTIGYPACIKASPNGGLVMASFGGNFQLSPGDLYLLDFDNATGQFSSPRPLPAIGKSILSFEFSPNSRYLFVSDIDLTTAEGEIVQYNVEVADFVATGNSLGNPVNAPFGSCQGLQLAPDGKIYYKGSSSGLNALSRINCPNTSNPSIEYTVFSYENDFQSLPNFSASLFENYNDTYVSLGADTVYLCEVGGSITLNAQNPGAGFLWSNGSTQQSIVVNTPGTYSVTVNGTCGTGADTVYVRDCNFSIGNSPIDLCNITEVAFSFSGSRSFNALSWDFGDPASGASNVSDVVNPQHVFSQSGSFTVTAVVEFSCGIDTVQTIVNLEDTTDFLSVEDAFLSIVLGDSAQLIAIGGQNYSWTPTDGLSCSNCASPLASPSQSTTYIVTGTNLSGCVQTDTIRVELDIRCNTPFIPTIFSPNAKGPQANESFCVLSDCVEQFKLSIFNRWGEKVFESEDISQCWDGTYKGSEAAKGSYAFNLYIKRADETIVSKSGTITLVR
jgi:gliding motility-associated-like protein